jgi:carbonic anhydrase/acetyltransferase-like protein (isoleucine patch superfamily)
MTDPQDVVDALTGTHDFGDGCGPVAAQRHVNPDGSVGGWVAEAVNQSDAELWVAPGACVGGKVTLMGVVRVEGVASVTGGCHLRNAVVCDNASVSEDVFIGHRHPEMGKPVIAGNARVSGSGTTVIGNSVITGDAYVTGNGTEISESVVEGHARVLGGLIYRSTIAGCATIAGQPNVSGGAVVRGRAAIFDKARIHGKFIIEGNVFIHGNRVLDGEGGTVASVADLALLAVTLT